MAKSKTSLKYSISLTFYHANSKRFFGSTVMGQQVEGLSMKDLLKRGEETNAALPAAAPPANVVINVTHDEILYWYSRVVDQARTPGTVRALGVASRVRVLTRWWADWWCQDCMAVLELVATEIDPNYGVSLNQYACGWTILRPFGNPSIKVLVRHS